ncbi:MAG: PilT/PilU family type 4a pilus ATPase [Blastocatellia bacterium]
MSVEQLLKSAKALGAQQICLEAGKTALILVNGNIKELTKTPLTPYDIFKLISPIMPEEKKVALVGQPTTEFTYKLEGATDFQVVVLKEANGIKVLFRDNSNKSNSGDLAASLTATQPFSKSTTQPLAAVNAPHIAPQPVMVANLPPTVALPVAKPVMAQPAQPDTAPLPVQTAKPVMAQPVTASPATASAVASPDATALLDEQQRTALAQGRPPDPRPPLPTPPKAQPFAALPAIPAPSTPITPVSAASVLSTSGSITGTMTGFNRTGFGINTERQKLRQDIDKLLERTLKMRGSDLHIATGAPPIVRRFGTLMRVEGETLEIEKARAIVREILTDEQFRQFEKTGDLDFSYEVIGVGRFRGNVLRQNRGIDLTFHVVPAEIVSPETLGLPPLVRELTHFHQGLILITGAAGQGKSTTISSLVDVINSERALHILTVEDPIEFVHPIDKKAIVNQREVGRHTKSFANALRAALREDPDVIVVGEMRDLETISLAVTASETGHLVMGTLMTSSAHQTVDRILESFPPAQQNQIRAMLSDSLRAVISQRLLPMADNSGMVLAAEILLGTPAVANLIREKKTFQIPSIIQTNRHLGMRRMDDALLELVHTGKVNPQKALDFAFDKKAFEASIKRV